MSSREPTKQYEDDGRPAMRINCGNEQNGIRRRHVKTSLKSRQADAPLSRHSGHHLCGSRIVLKCLSDVARLGQGRIGARVMRLDFMYWEWSGNYLHSKWDGACSIEDEGLRDRA